MQQFIVITTINPKSASIAQFERLSDWHIVVVGDQKSHPIKNSANLTFLSIDDQRKLNYRLVEATPYNHYARKNIGYLYAIQHGAEIIYDTDDDNSPYPHWQAPPFVCSRQYTHHRPFVNIYRYFTDAMIWPRGYPLEEVLASANPQLMDTDNVAIGVWQGLADNDPDVDAIYRLTVNSPVQFRRHPPVFLGKGEYCPFNSQNTFWNKKAFPYLYLPATTSFRYTDILRGYVTQCLLWQQDLHLGFTEATVYQDRNAHNLMKDFQAEIEGYLTTKPIVELLGRIEYNADSLDNLRAVYQALVQQGFVPPKETEICDAWQEDYRKLMEQHG